MTKNDQQFPTNIYEIEDDEIDTTTTVQSPAIPFDIQNPTNNLTPIFTAFFQALSSSIFSTAGSTVLRSALNNNTLQDQNDMVISSSNNVSIYNFF